MTTLSTVQTRSDRRMLGTTFNCIDYGSSWCLSGGSVVPATSEGFFKNTGTLDVDIPARSVEAPASANLEEEATPANDDVTKDHWVDRQTVVIGVHKVVCSRSGRRSSADSSVFHRCYAVHEDRPRSH